MGVAARARQIGKVLHFTVSDRNGLALALRRNKSSGAKKMKKIAAIAIGCILATSIQAQEWRFEQAAVGSNRVFLLTLETTDISNCMPKGEELAGIVLRCFSNDPYVSAVFGISKCGIDFPANLYPDKEMDVLINGVEIGTYNAHIVSGWKHEFRGHSLFNFSTSTIGSNSVDKVRQAANASSFLQMHVELPEISPLAFVANFESDQVSFWDGIARLSSYCRM